VRSFQDGGCQKVVQVCQKKAAFKVFLLLGMFRKDKMFFLKNHVWKLLIIVKLLRFVF